MRQAVRPKFRGARAVWRWRRAARPFGPRPPRGHVKTPAQTDNRGAACAYECLHAGGAREKNLEAVAEGLAEFCVDHGLLNNLLHGSGEGKLLRGANMPSPQSNICWVECVQPCGAKARMRRATGPHNRLALRKLQRTKRLLASRAQTGAPRGGHTVEGPTRGVPLVCGRHCAWRRDRHERDHAKHRIRQFVRSLGGRRPPRKRPGREARVSRGCPQGPKGHHGDQDNPKGCPKDAKGNPRVPRGSPADRKGNPKEPQEGLKGAQQDPRESRGGSKGRRAGPGGREGGSRGALARVLGPIGTSLFTGKV
jgi:hypothetical protein